MTMDERVEAAARALWAKSWLDGKPRWSWEDLNGVIREAWKDDARVAIAAAFPACRDDKAHWLAPLEPTTEMLWRARAAMRKAGLLPAYTDESTNGAPPIMNVMLAEAAWPAMRDAYLGKGDE